MGNFNFRRCEFEDYSETLLEERADIDRQAKSLAAQNEPAPNENSFSAPEQNAIQIIKGHYNAGISNISSIINEYSENLSNARSSILNISYGSIISDMRNEYEAKTPLIKNELNSVSNKIEEAENAKRVFMMSNHLAREPYIRSNLHTLFGLLTIAILVVLETYINGRIMGPVLAGGELEGRGYAITIAVINVFGSFGVGLLVFRYFNHIEKAFKYWAYLGAFLYVMAISYVNLAAGVFRGIAEEKSRSFNSSELDAERFLPSANEVASEAFWPLDNLEALTFQSQLFIGMGIIFALLSVLDGYFFDDPYPDYGSKGKKIEGEKNKINDIKTRSLTDFNKIKNKYQSKAGAVTDERKKGVERWGDVVDALQQSVINFKVWVQNLRDVVQHTIICFQQTNALYRSDGLKPAYFLSNEDSEYQQNFEFRESEKDPEIIFGEVWSDYMQDDDKEDKMKKWIDEIDEKDMDVQKQISSIHKEKIDELMEII